MHKQAILFLYLTDEILSRLLPFSSGLFALAAILIALSQPARKLPSTSFLIFLMGVLTLLGAGTVGALLSQTPIGLFFLMTLTMLAMLWLTGMRLGAARALISPRHAMLGVTISCIAMVPSLIGVDPFGLLTNAVVLRGAGLYSEPSHLALYVLPLMAIAWSMTSQRRGVVIAWVWLAATCFSLTYLLSTLVISAIGLAISKPARHRRLSSLIAKLALCLALPLVVLTVPLSVEGVPLNDYVLNRLRGLGAGAAIDDNPNLSALVVLQGMDLAIDSLHASWGLGVGVGNFGTSLNLLTNNPYRVVITGIMNEGQDLNVRDGAMLMNKLTGEMGIFVIVFVIIFISSLRRILGLDGVALRQYHAAMLAGFICLIFIRALPTFAAPTCMGLLSLAALATSRRQTRLDRLVVHPTAVSSAYSKT
jgi:hypothetical protein